MLISYRFPLLGPLPSTQPSFSTTKDTCKPAFFCSCLLQVFISHPPTSNHPSTYEIPLYFLQSLVPAPPPPHTHLPIPCQCCNCCCLYLPVFFSSQVPNPGFREQCGWETRSPPHLCFSCSFPFSSFIAVCHRSNERDSKQITSLSTILY